MTGADGRGTRSLASASLFAGGLDDGFGVGFGVVLEAVLGEGVNTHFSFARIGVSTSGPEAGFDACVGLAGLADVAEAGAVATALGRAGTGFGLTALSAFSVGAGSASAGSSIACCFKPNQFCFVSRIVYF